MGWRDSILTAPERTKLTWRARQALHYALKEAQSFRHSRVSVGDLLLGLIRERDGLAGHALSDLGVDLDQARAAAEAGSAASENVAPQSVEIGDDVRGAFGFAADEARRLGHHYIGTEHVLLGLLQGEQSGAVVLLDRLGVSTEAVRGRVGQLLSQSPS